MLGLYCRMSHISVWHALNADDPRTYLKVKAPVQVEHENGGYSEGRVFQLGPSRQS
jgi:hypothetical protein